ncbi:MULTISPECIES: DUF7683 domain-containing protein [Chryseobacterium]|uniref:DUF7683 domain-containing protein n=1 Tax=Chryseobacterium camelliae TaxID=1265445 RepID=A0ABU0TE04_9FLAO|nr:MULTISPECIES: hypothetical protein [Chryseobacterium]MDT3406985.1 hypothetical protein [Pseudacidovorax intermedius]MDQ1095222.1 hypothetical protein [Chryseobacterium camelliae]MDQ1099160.1 hypothetical protein [Chryseobacterium sp. SORGH_AS_1048]MDR6086509.1 hypothetical protein [Chryseobacterium sp. SORGH_AS_0909]MDR6130880.1 hypothetical protein [Chryseobacterium sp. SORGH_AS_1175]
MIKRVIEEFSIENEIINQEYDLDITPKEIIRVLDDFSLADDDNEDEIYGQYTLSEEQIQKLKPFLKDPLYEDLEKYTYELSCYEEQEVSVSAIQMEKIRSVKEFSKLSNEINKSYGLEIDSKEILKILDDLSVDEDDENLDEVYKLTDSQIEKLKPFLKENLNQNIEKYDYYLYHWYNEASTEN